MPSSIALCLCAVFVIWLFAKDSQRRPGVSAALWIPLTWLFIISSKPVAQWLGLERHIGPDGLPEDVWVDKIVYLLLIVLGMYVLGKRRIDWNRLVTSNKWVLVFLLYLGISVLWSDESFVSFKRWIKHFGNAIMVLVVLSEESPQQSIRAFLARIAYLVIPISVLLVKYYPEISMKYDKWTNEPMFVGLTGHKNMLGMALFVCGLSLVWLLLEVLSDKKRASRKAELFAYFSLLLMTMWLLRKAHCATGLGCIILGCCILLAVKVPAIRFRVRRIETYVLATAAVVVLLQVSGLWTYALKEGADVLGRDVSLHGRTQIWEAVFKEDINPLIGTGFYSFWSEERNRRISQTYYYALGTAHNGYVETYLNSGIIGLMLLVTMIAVSLKRIKEQVADGSEYGALRLAFLITILFYNISESALDRLVPVWLILVLVLVEPPQRVPQRIKRAATRSFGEASLATEVSARMPSF